MVTLKYSQKENLKEIAICHKSAFPDSLSSQMGIRYLKKMIEWYLSDDKKFLFHIEENGKCVGYCGGMIDDGLQATGSASGMIQYSFNDAIKSIMLRPWLLFHKELLSKYKLIKKNIKLKVKKSSRSNNKNTEKRNTNKHEIQTGLVVIGVSKDFQGKGFGSLLLQEFENRTRRLDIKTMSLTVKNDNHQAIRSYERNGWIRFKLNGNSLEMVKRLD